MTAQWTHPLPVPSPDGPPGRGSGRGRRREGWGCDDPVAYRAMAREREAVRRTDRQPRPGHDPAGAGEGRCSAWLAAYALGLAHTNNSPGTCVLQLLTSADGCLDLLDDARVLSSVSGARANRVRVARSALMLGIGHES